MFGTVMIPGFLLGRVLQTSWVAFNPEELYPLRQRIGKCAACTHTLVRFVARCGWRAPVVQRARVAQDARNSLFSDGSLWKQVIGSGDFQWDKNHSLERNHRTHVAARVARNRRLFAPGVTTGGGRGDGRDRTHVFSRQRVRPRLPVSSGFLARCCRPVARRYFFPRWAEWANWGYGEPRFVFYPPASWMLGATLGTLLPWKMAPGAFIWLALVLAGYSMWRFAREWLTPHEAAAAAVLYAVNPYHLIIVYYRADFAELLASALLPLALCGMVRLLRQGWRGVHFLAVPFALIWLANAPAAVLATYSLMLLFFVACILRRNLRPLLLGGVSMAAGFGLAAFYIFPAAYEQRWVQIRQVLADLLSPDQNFLFTHASDPEFLFFNWKVSGVAMGVMLVTGIAAVIVARRRREFPEIWWMLLALGSATVLLMFPPSMFLWRTLPKLEFVQFPWRWLGVLDFVFAFFLAAAIGRAKRPWLGGLAIAIVLTTLASALLYDGWWDSEDIPVLTKSIQTGRGYEGTDEYQPLGSDRYELPGSDPQGEIIGKARAAYSGL